MDEIIKIKKYGNRRYYSSADKSYITLAEIEKWIQKGHKIQVTDAETDADITSEVLTQILLEQGRAQHFPVEMLETMIRMNEKTLNSFWTPLMEQNIKLMSQMGELALNNVKAIISPFKKKKSSSSTRTRERKN
ncbi:polyhydroxyalkanoate synthesis regulator DNA-binding domain-containing protein [Bdellovibrio sp.]|uniref:polyhydroxyalkanoate synthesis regulator DNA-binding domain-containing protein n=1 Tax=Bdellovibrio sp. TaxID=28201 RepID=UPI0039E4C91A